MDLIYADNAATTVLDKDAFEAMQPFMLQEYGNASQPYSFSRHVRKALQDARETISKCINADPEEIIFTSGGTESDNWAIKSTMIDPGNSQSLVTSQIEHHAVLNSAKNLERLGYKVIYVPVTFLGTVSIEIFDQAVSSGAKLASIMMVNNEIGTIQPIKELARIAHSYGATFHTDAVQAVGHIPIDVKKMQVDLLSSSGHKFNGPKGIGFLYIRKGTALRPYVDGGSQEYGLRAGTENIAAIVGMAVALKKNVARMEQTARSLRKMERTLLGILDNAGIDYLYNGASSENRAPGNINISIKGADGEMLLHRLDLRRICISTGSACDSKSTQVSHVIRAIHVPEEYSRGTIRISFGANNSLSDAIEIGNALISILSK